MSKKTTQRLNPYTHNLRTLPNKKLKRLRHFYPTNPIFLVLDSVYDTFNIGSFFRLADAIGVQELLLCGITATPPNKKISRSAIGLDRFVHWKYFKTAPQAIQYLRTKHKANITVVEQTEKSIPYIKMQITTPIALIFGSETYGVSQEAIDLADQRVFIPMYGINRSLNVTVSAGIVSYWVLHNLSTQ